MFDSGTERSNSSRNPTTIGDTDENRASLESAMEQEVSQYDDVMAEHESELGDLSDLRNGQFRVFPELGSHGVVVCRVNGELHAVADNCSHRDAKLSEGRLRGALLTCPLHGAQFDVRSGIHQGPPASVPIPCFAVQELEGIATVVFTD
jgi:3-phenylpropionate/trans-cinnamate dioxygenase ferredoxin component